MSLKFELSISLTLLNFCNDLRNYDHKVLCVAQSSLCTIILSSVNCFYGIQHHLHKRKQKLKNSKSTKKTFISIENRKKNLSHKHNLSSSTNLSYCCWVIQRKLTPPNYSLLIPSSFIKYTFVMNEAIGFHSWFVIARK